jgi:hypothetical protein
MIEQSSGAAAKKLKYRRWEISTNFAVIGPSENPPKKAFIIE